MVLINYFELMRLIWLLECLKSLKKGENNLLKFLLSRTKKFNSVRERAMLCDKEIKI